MPVEPEWPQHAPERGHFGAWRAVVALPAMIASALLLIVLLGWMGTWEGLGLLSWLSCGLLTLTHRGERVAVRLACGFRRPSPTDAAALAPVWSEVLARCGTPADRVDLYVHRSGAVNAYAVGSRSVAVTSRVVADYHAGRINDELLAPIVAHELGHHATKDAQFIPLTLWLAAPWRLAYRLVLRLSTRLAGRQPLGPLAVVIVATVTVAIVQAVQQRAWSTVVILGALTLFSIATPLADAALSRASERAADQYAARAGYGDALAHALQTLDGDTARRTRTTVLILDGHPSTDRRIRDLTAPRHRRAVSASVS
jgi:STE24 endopeptidase